MQRHIFPIAVQNYPYAEYFPQIEKADLETCCEHIGKNQSITHLKLKGEIDDTVLVALAAQISRLHHLVVLHVCGTYSGAGLVALAESISHQTCLQELVLKGQFQDDGLAAIGKILPQFPNLERLKIFGDFHGDGLLALAENISQCSLLTLEVVGNFEDEGVAELAEGISKLPLETLNISGSFGNFAAACLSKSLHKLTLKHLYLAGDFGDEGAIVIASAINSQRLKTLKVDGSFASTGMAAIAYSLLSENSLINISNSTQASEITFGTETIKQFKIKKTMLKNLLLGTFLTDDDILLLAPLLVHGAPHLEHLSIRAEFTQFAKLAKIINVLSLLNIKNIEFIDISGIPKDDDDIQHFIDAVINNNTIHTFELCSSTLTKTQALRIANSVCNIKSQGFKEFNMICENNFNFRYFVKDKTFTLAERYLFRSAIAEAFCCDRIAFPTLLNFCTFFIKKTFKSLSSAEELKIPPELYEKLTNNPLLHHIPAENAQESETENSANKKFKSI